VPCWAGPWHQIQNPPKKSNVLVLLAYMEPGGCAFVVAKQPFVLADSGGGEEHESVTWETPAAPAGIPLDALSRPNAPSGRSTMNVTLSVRSAFKL
jgi:hypothetical protein